MGDKTERCPSGITGFDKICQGGFVRNSANVLVGGPGSGKTTFLLQFLHNGATKFDENGLYCSFEPDVVEIVKDGSVFGWDFDGLNKEGKVKFFKFSPGTSIPDLKIELTKLIAKYDIRRICIDPISVLTLNMKDESKAREQIFDLVSLIKLLKVTCILADEDLSADSDNPKGSIIKYLTDSVTMLHESGLSGVGDRAIRITKMRRTSHSRGPVGMSISDKGITVIPGS